MRGLAFGSATQGILYKAALQPPLPVCESQSCVTQPCQTFRALRKKSFQLVGHHRHCQYVFLASPFVFAQQSKIAAGT